METPELKELHEERKKLVLMKHANRNPPEGILEDIEALDYILECECPLQRGQRQSQYTKEYRAAKKEGKIVIWPRHVAERLRKKGLWT